MNMGCDGSYEYMQEEFLLNKLPPWVGWKWGVGQNVH